MEIVGSVAPEEVPQGYSRARKVSKWQTLIDRIVTDHRNGRVTMVKLKDDKELKAMRNGLAVPLRKQNFLLNPTVVPQEHGLLVFMALKLRQVETQPVVATPPVENNNRPIAEAWGAR